MNESKSSGSFEESLPGASFPFHFLSFSLRLWHLFFLSPKALTYSDGMLEVIGRAENLSTIHRQTFSLDVHWDRLAQLATEIVEKSR